MSTAGSRCNREVFRACCSRKAAVSDQLEGNVARSGLLAAVALAAGHRGAQCLRRRGQGIRQHKCDRCLRRRPVAREHGSSFGRALGQQPAFATDFLDGSSWSTLVEWCSHLHVDVERQRISDGLERPDAAQLVHARLQCRPTGQVAPTDCSKAPTARRLVLSEAGPGDGGGGPGQFHHPSGVGIQWQLVSLGLPRAQAAAFVGYWQQIVTTMRSVAGQRLPIRVESHGG